MNTPTIDGDGGGAALEEIAVPDQKADAEQDHQNGKHRVDDVVDMGLTPLLLLLELLFTETLTARVLAGLLLSGCTHSLFSPLVQLAMRVVHDRTFLKYYIRNDPNFQEEKRVFLWAGAAFTFYSCFRGGSRRKKEPRQSRGPSSKWIIYTPLWPCGPV